MLSYIVGKNWVLTDLKNAWDETGRYYIATFENKKGTFLGFPCKNMQFVFFSFGEERVPFIRAHKITISKNNDAEGKKIQQTVKKFMEQFDEEDDCPIITEHKNDVQILTYLMESDEEFFKISEKNDDLGNLFSQDADEEQVQKVEKFLKKYQKNKAFEEAWNKLTLNERAHCWSSFELSDEGALQRFLDAVKTKKKCEGNL